MPRVRIVATLLFSIALIGVALWSRLARDANAPKNIAVVSNTERLSNDFVYNEVFLKDISSASSTPLSNTDLVARQLFSYFIDLTSRGQASPDNIQDLAERYAEGILNQGTTVAKKVTLNEISVVLDSEENLSAYSQSVNSILKKYAAKV